MQPAPTAKQWQAHYAAGRDFRPLSAAEKRALRDHLPRPDEPAVSRALEIACGTGELARHLAGLGFRVDAVDFAEAAIERAAAASPPTITYHCLDVTAGDLSALAAHDGRAYEVITIRRALAHLPDRTRIAAGLGALLTPGGTLCVITPHADRHPEDQRGICLDEPEIELLTAGWGRTDRIEADRSTVLFLREPRTGTAHSPAGTTAPAPR